MIADTKRSLALVVGGEVSKRRSDKVIRGAILENDRRAGQKDTKEEKNWNVMRE